MATLASDASDTTIGDALFTFNAGSGCVEFTPSAEGTALCVRGTFSGLSALGVARDGAPPGSAATDP
eukprot:1494163-Pleurochrysis_carterae.AAC.1